MSFVRWFQALFEARAVYCWERSVLWGVLLGLFFSCSSSLCAVDYLLRMEGAPAALEPQLMQESQLERLRRSPPATLAGLRKRMEYDVKDLLKVMQSAGYFSAVINSEVDSLQAPAVVTLKVIPGPLYTIGSVTISLESGQQKCDADRPSRGRQENPKQANGESAPESVSQSGTEGVTAENGVVKSRYELLQLPRARDLKLEMGAPAFPKQFLDAEELLLNFLRQQSLPFARVVAHALTADPLFATVSMEYGVDPGPYARFGEVTVVGREEVDESYLLKKICWKEGSLFSPEKLEATEDALEATALFSEIEITYPSPEEIGEDSLCASGGVEEAVILPITVRVREAKMRSIGFGVSYQDHLGFGLTSNWQHRNMRGVGETLNVEGNLWFGSWRATASYLVPEFLSRKQELVYSSEILRSETKGFTETSGTAALRVLRRHTRHYSSSYGIAFKELLSTDSDADGTFSLVKVPLSFRWHSGNDPLDPTNGLSLDLTVTPALQLHKEPFSYITQQCSLAAYLAFFGRCCVVAMRGTFGTILGSPLHTIPPPERFFGGSESLLRGYHTYTVSPLNDAGEPIGGSSLMVYSLELRIRSKPMGWVLFYDVGNVYNSKLPHFHHHQLQSVGIGIRYATPVGPIRLDLAIPLNRRPKLDHPFQVYASIGQAF